MPEMKQATPGEQLFRGALEVLILERRGQCDAWLYLPAMGGMVATAMKVAAEYLEVLSKQRQSGEQRQGQQRALLPQPQSGRRSTTHVDWLP